MPSRQATPLRASKERVSIMTLHLRWLRARARSHRCRMPPRREVCRRWRSFKSSSSPRPRKRGARPARMPRRSAPRASHRARRRCLVSVPDRRPSDCTDRTPALAPPNREAQPLCTPLRGPRRGGTECAWRARVSLLLLAGRLRIDGVGVDPDALARGDRQGLQLVVREQSGHAIGRRPDVGGLQVDVAGDAPGPVIGPPQARAAISRRRHSRPAHAGQVWLLLAAKRGCARWSRTSP